MIFRPILMLVACFILLSLTVCGAPLIIDWNNSLSVDNPDSLYPVVPYNTNITFNITANESFATSVWYVDNVANNQNPSGTVDNFTASFTVAGYHNVSVRGTNATGDTQLLTWFPYVQRQLGSTTPLTVDTTYYNNLTSAFEGETDIWDFFFAAAMVFINVVGGIFFAIIFGVLYYTMWSRGKSIILPTTMAFIMGTFMFGLMPPEYKIYGILFTSIGGLAIVYRMFAKNRS